MKQWLRILDVIDRGIAAIERSALIAGVLGMTGISIANVIMRNVFDASLVFTDEINQAFIVIVTFLGIGYAARLGRHIRMTALYDAFSRPARKMLMIAIALTTALLLLTLAWYALQYVQHVQRMNAVTPALQIPLYLIYAVVPAGLALGAVQYLLAAARNLFEHEVYVSFRHTDGYEEAAESEPTGRSI
jgi:TRAP-type C4-dicarboxylate transport system permease small subunit